MKKIRQWHTVSDDRMHTARCPDGERWVFWDQIPKIQS